MQLISNCAREEGQKPLLQTISSMLNNTGQQRDSLKKVECDTYVDLIKILKVAKCQKGKQSHIVILEKI